MITHVEEQQSRIHLASKEIQAKLEAKLAQLRLTYSQLTDNELDITEIEYNRQE